MTNTKRIGTRLAVFGCALALVTMAGVGMTFAKYTKSANTSEAGTVAAFGVTLADSGSLFSNQYNVKTGTTDFSDNTITYSVKDAASATNPTNMVAPGTSGSKTFTATLNGNQVAVNVAIDLTITLSDGWKVTNNTAYEPITWTLSKTDGTTTKHYNGTGWGDSSANLTAAQVTAATTSDNFGPNQSSKTITYTLSWNWEFEYSSEKYLVITDITTGDYSTSGEAKSAGTIIDSDTYGSLKTESKNKCITTDEADTLLGNAGSATVTVATTLTATQID